MTRILELISRGTFAEKIVAAYNARAKQIQRRTNGCDQSISVADLIDGHMEGDVLCSISSQVKMDLVKVDFDLENFESVDAFSDDHRCEAFMGLQRTPQLTALSTAWLGCTAGGDWEAPIFFIFYWDGNQIRAYIPTKGNTWNTKTGKAYGNCEDADDAPECDVEELLVDVFHHIRSTKNA